MEVGHCAQNIHLESIAMGLVSVPIGAFQDDAVKEVMKLPTPLVPLYIIPIGYP
jgi:nitroreductase